MDVACTLLSTHVTLCSTGNQLASLLALQLPARRHLAHALPAPCQPEAMAPAGCWQHSIAPRSSPRRAIRARTCAFVCTGRPGEQAVEVARLIERGLRESRAVDQEALWWCRAGRWAEGVGGWVGGWGERWGFKRGCRDREALVVVSGRKVRGVVGVVFCQFTTGERG